MSVTTQGVDLNALKDELVALKYDVIDTVHNHTNEVLHVTALGRDRERIVVSREGVVVIGGFIPWTHIDMVRTYTDHARLGYRIGTLPE